VHRDTTHEHHTRQEYHEHTQGIPKRNKQEGEGESYHKPRKLRIARQEPSDEILIQLTWHSLANYAEQQGYARPQLESFLLRVTSHLGTPVQTKQFDDVYKRSAVVYHLKPDTTYHFQLIALVEGGHVVEGQVTTYTT